MPATLLTSASCALTAPTRQPLCIFRYVLSVSMNYFVRGCTSCQTCGSFDGGLYFFADHQISFAPRASATSHQLHHPKRNYSACFDCQHHQRIKHTVRSTCDKENGQILFRDAHLSGIRFPEKQTRVGTKADSHTWSGAASRLGSNMS